MSAGLWRHGGNESVGYGLGWEKESLGVLVDQALGPKRYR